MTDREAFADLRKPFPPEVVGKLPRAGIKLDYVGHAAVTDRLLSVDPQWTWEPVAVDERGLPAYDNKGGLWIRLTVCGVTRLGYGDGPDPKQRIGDALRNAAMRFGVALDLWTRDELESHVNGSDLPRAVNAEHVPGAGETPAGCGSDPPVPPTTGTSEDRAIDRVQADGLANRLNALPQDVRRAFMTAKGKAGLKNGDPEFVTKALVILDEVLASS